MKRESVLALVRHGLTFGGGMLASSGMASESQVSELVGALITIIGVTWSIIEKRNRGEAEVAVAVKLESPKGGES